MYRRAREGAGRDIPCVWSQCCTETPVHVNSFKATCPERRWARVALISCRRAVNSLYIQHSRPLRCPPPQCMGARRLLSLIDASYIPSTWLAGVPQAQQLQEQPARARRARRRRARRARRWRARRAPAAAWSRAPAARWRAPGSR